MSWAHAVPAILVALAVLYWAAPALLLGLRLAPLASVALAPALGVLVLTSSAVMADLTNTPWGWHWVAGVAALLVAGLLTGRLVVRRRRGALTQARGVVSPRIALTYAAGIAVAGLALAPGILDALVGPRAFAQRFDNVFHLNAIHLAASGQASPFNLEPLTHGSFYPAAWHEWAGVVVQLTGVDVRIASQACILVVIFAVWPLGIAWLVEVLVEPGLAGRLAVGPLAFSSVAFPLTLAWWGPLMANLLGIGLTPVLLAAGWDLLGRRATPALGLPGAVTLAGLAGGAVAVSHPNAALSAGLLLLPVTLAALWPLVRHRDLRAVRGSRLLTVAVLAFVVVLPVVWYLLGRVIAAATIRDPFATPTQALNDVLLGTSLLKPAVPSLTIGLVVGLGIAATVRRWRPLVVSFVLVSVIYFAASALETEPVMLLLTAPYYTDPYRIAAAAALLVVPLAVLGWDRVAALIGDHLPQRANGVLAAVLAATLLAVTLLAPGLRLLRDEVRVDYLTSTDSRVLTPDELTIIERLPTTTPPGSVLVVNSFQGASLAFALADRAVTDYYMYAVPTPAARYLASNLRHAANDPAVCAALSETRAEYALVLEPFEIPAPPGTASAHEGLRGLDNAPGFQRVDAEGATALYRITACG